VLKGAGDGVTPLEATRMYFTFAQEQLGRAAGSEIAGSMALHGLGKLHSALAEQERLRTRSAESKAMTYLQAALLANPKNYMASNDLGVLLARAGYFAEARLALEHSVGISPQPAGWRNLAEVDRRLGDQQGAARAAQQCQLAARDMAQRRLTPGSRVEWIDPPQFAQTFAQTPSAREPLPPRQPAKTEQPVAQNPFGNLFEKR
jgi:tetratricopeptide (TPR) repeat protein